MADTSALILRVRDGQDELPVALRTSELAVITLDTGGAGRLLHQAYSVAGRAFEKTLGRAAHKLGTGPTATSCRIKKALGDDAFRQSMLDSIYDSLREDTTRQNLRDLKKDCHKLLKYALPSRPLVTQIDTFRNIIMLTTRYPGLRGIFVKSPDMDNVADSPEAIGELWRCTENIYDKESLFVLEFAAHCLARSDPSSELEGILPSKLGCTRETGRGVVDTLTGYRDEGFPRLIAIRYLAGILELPAFWLDDYYQVHKHIMDKLCKQTLSLIEDVNPDSVTADDLGRLALFDPDGVDALADAVLVGGRKWIQREPGFPGLASDYWVPNFVKIIDVLRGLIISDFLPLASQRAAGDWEDSLKDITDQLPMSSSDWQYEDVYVRANVQVDPGSDNPSRSNWRPSDINEESLNVDDERPSSLLKAFTSAFRETFLGRAASTVRNTPSDSLAAGDRQDTPEGRTLAEESDEAETISHRPSSLLAHINAATREQVSSSNSPTNDETTQENYLESETPGAVDGMLAGEPSPPADVGNTFHGIGEDHLTDSTRSDGRTPGSSDNGGMEASLFRDLRSVNIHSGNFIMENGPDNSQKTINHHATTINDRSRRVTNYGGYRNYGLHVDGNGQINNYGSQTTNNGPIHGYRQYAPTNPPYPGRAPSSYDDDNFDDDFQVQSDRLQAGDRDYFGHHPPASQSDPRLGSKSQSLQGANRVRLPNRPTKGRIDFASPEIRQEYESMSPTMKAYIRQLGFGPPESLSDVMANMTLDDPGIPFQGKMSSSQQHRRRYQTPGRDPDSNINDEYDDDSSDEDGPSLPPPRPRARPLPRRPLPERPGNDSNINDDYDDSSDEDGPPLPPPRPRARPPPRRPQPERPGNNSNINDDDDSSDEDGPSLPPPRPRARPPPRRRPQPERPGNDSNINDDDGDSSDEDGPYLPPPRRRVQPSAPPPYRPQAERPRNVYNSRNEELENLSPEMRRYIENLLERQGTPLRPVRVSEEISSEDKSESDGDSVTTIITQR